jgi:hypothetical protein
MSLILAIATTKSIRNTFGTWRYCHHRYLRPSYCVQQSRPFTSVIVNITLLKCRPRLLPGDIPSRLSPRPPLVSPSLACSASVRRCCQFECHIVYSMDLQYYSRPMVHSAKHDTWTSLRTREFSWNQISSGFTGRPDLANLLFLTKFMVVRRKRIMPVKSCRPNFDYPTSLSQPLLQHTSSVYILLRHIEGSYVYTPRGKYYNTVNLPLLGADALQSA